LPNCELFIKQLEHFAGKVTIVNEVLFDVWLGAASKESEVLDRIKNQFGAIKLTNEELDYLKNASKNFCKMAQRVWNKAKSDASKVRRDPWLKIERVFELKSNPGRPEVPFRSKRKASKHKAASELAMNHESALLVEAARTAARREHDKDLAEVLKQTGKSPTRAKKIKQILSNESDPPRKMTPEEALAFLFDNNLTKDQYFNIRRESINRNADIFPPYYLLQQSKARCRPQDIVIKEQVAEVPLQSILDHTSARIVKLQADVLKSISHEEGCIKAELVASYGFDGSTGQANYNQRQSESMLPPDAESSLFVTSMTPLQLIDSNARVIWRNRTPHSVRFCRPIKVEFVKESKDVIKNEHARMKREISCLKSFACKIDGNKEIDIKFSLHLTAIDGKVLNTITNTTSNQCCPICKCTSKDFLNNVDFKSEKFSPRLEALQHGVSPLHCWIRFFEFILNAGYKSGIKKARRQGHEEKQQYLQKKKEIQNSFLKKLSLRVSMAKCGGFGGSNTGNVARVAFKNHALFAEITGIDEEVIFRLKIVLIALCCQLPLDINKFEEYCFKTAEVIVNKLPWCPMTPTVHKVLVHSRQIMENMVLPVAFFGEDEAESRNKFYKSDRLHHSRKSSRLNNISDVFHRAIDTSDPLVSSIGLESRVKRHKKEPLPSEVLQLLECPQNITQASAEMDLDVNESDDEDYCASFEYNLSCLSCSESDSDSELGN